MNQITIKKTDDTILTLDIPSNLSETTLSAKVAFDTYREEIDKWKVNLVADTEPELTYYLYHVSEALSEFFDKDITDFLELDIKPFLNDQKELDIDVFTGSLKGEYQISNYEDVEANLLSLYGSVSILCDSYTYEKFEYADNKMEFEYLGESYEAPGVVSKTFTGKRLYSSINTIQAVEALQAKKILKGLLKEEDPDKRKDNTYTSYLKMFACMVKKKGEKIPLAESKFNQWVENKIVTFQDIDAKTAFDVVFFCVELWKTSEQTRITRGFSNLSESLIPMQKKKTTVSGRK